MDNKLQSEMENETKFDRFEKFFELYHMVFDKSGSVRNCGRNTCKNLIIAANRIDSSVYFGNVNTGVMDVEAIQELYSKLQKIVEAHRLWLQNGHNTKDYQV